MGNRLTMIREVLFPTQPPLSSIGRHFNRHGDNGSHSIQDRPAQTSYAESEAAGGEQEWTSTDVRHGGKSLALGR
jgi:hypothetical protein